MMGTLTETRICNILLLKGMYEFRDFRLSASMDVVILDLPPPYMTGDATKAMKGKLQVIFVHIDIIISVF